jgi:hypothetical protein
MCTCKHEGIEQGTCQFCQAYEAALAVGRIYQQTGDVRVFVNKEGLQ